jgi:hypothetical protein
VAPVRLKSLNVDAIRDWVGSWVREAGDVRSGDRIVFVADTELSSGVHDTVLVWSVP